MKTKKRLFIGLLSVSLLVLVFLIFLIWFLAVNRNLPIYRILLAVFIVFLGSVFVIIGTGIVGMVLTIYHVKKIPSIQSFMRMATNLLFPFALALGRMMGYQVDQIRGSFIEVNNQMVQANQFKLLPEQVLVLAPHCLQKSKCPHKITIDINNCRMCGECPVYDLRKLADRYGVKLLFATGGTLARKFIEKYHPQGIVAIACERDLTSGILDANPLPVLGVLNQRPEGPCINTGVKIGQVEDAIRFFISSNKMKAGG